MTTIGTGTAKAWRTVRRLLNLPLTTRVKHVLVASGLLIFGFGGVLHQQSTRDARDRARDTVNNAQASYNAERRAYDGEVAARNTCLTKVDTRDEIRAVLFSIVDLSDIFPGNDKAVAYTEQRIAVINAKYPQLDKRADCPTEPVPPAVPDGVT